MVEVVIGREIPQHWLPLNKYVVPKEQIVRFLSLFIKEGVVIITFETFHHVSRMACPLIDFPIRFHSIHEMRTAVLYGDGIAMIMIPRMLVRPISQSRFRISPAHMCVKRLTASVS